MDAFIVTVLIAIMAAMVAPMMCDHEATNEIVNWDGQRSTL